MTKRKQNRRAFIRGAAGAALSIPFLSSMHGAAAVPPPAGIRRVVFFYVPYGTLQRQWFPSDASTAQGRTVGRARETALSSISGDISPIFRRSVLGNLVDKMLMLDGIDGPFSIGHQKSFPLTSFLRDEPTSPSAISIDQRIAEKAQIYSTEPAFRLLNVAAGRGTHSGPSLSYVRNGDRVIPFPQIANPETLWDLAFESVARGLGADGFERLRRNRISVIDQVQTNYDRLLRHRNLSGVDRNRLMAYVQHLREYEVSVTDSMILDCDTPPRPSLDAFPRGHQSWMDVGAAMVDNIIHTLRCGLTNVVTFNSEPSSRSYEFPEFTNQEHHALSHSREDGSEQTARQQLAVDRHKVDLLAQLLRGLDVEEDPGSGRTFLDNSIVLVTSDMGSVSNHKGHRMPVVFFGGRGYLKQGAYVDFRSSYIRDYRNSPRSAGVGIAYNNVLITACQALGLRPEDYEGDGPGIGQYQTSSYYSRVFPGGVEEYEAFAYGDRRSPPAEILA